MRNNMTPKVVKPLRQHFPCNILSYNSHEIEGKESNIPCEEELNVDDDKKDSFKVGVTSLCLVSSSVTASKINNETQIETSDEDDNSSSDDEDLDFRCREPMDCPVKNSNVKNQLNLLCDENEKMFVYSSHENGQVYEWEITKYDSSSRPADLNSHLDSNVSNDCASAGLKLQYLPQNQQLLYHRRNGNISLHDIHPNSSNPRTAVIQEWKDNVATFGFCAAVVESNTLAYLHKNQKQIQLCDIRQYAAVSTNALSLQLASPGVSVNCMCMCLSLLRTTHETQETPQNLAVGMEDGSILIYDLRKPSKYITSINFNKKKEAPITCIDLLYDNNHDDKNNIIALRGIAGMAPSPTNTSYSTTVASFQILKSDNDGNINVTGTKNNIEIHRRPSPEKFNKIVPMEKMGVNACRMTSSNTCMVAGWDGRVRCYDIPPSNQSSNCYLQPYGYIYPHINTSVTCMEYSKNANVLITGTKHGSITLWPGPPPLL